MTTIPSGAVSKKMTSRRTTIILVSLVVIFAILFIIFLSLWLVQKNKPTLQERIRDPDIIKEFDLDGQNVLVNFSPEYQMIEPKSFLIEVSLLPFGEGTILSSRVGDKGWALVITKHNRLAFLSDSEKIEAVETETFNEDHDYQAVYHDGNLRLKRDGNIIAEGEIRVNRGYGPVFFGMMMKCDESGRCTPSDILNARLYRAQFVMNNTTMGIFDFEAKKKIFSDSHNRVFCKREATEFEFEARKDS